MREQKKISRSAIILAAGNGHRMGRLTLDRPKCLLEVGSTLIDARKPLGAEEMGVRLQFDCVREFSKELPPEQADGENVGIAKFGIEGGRRLIEHLEEIVAAGHEQAWAPLGFQALAREWPLRAVTTKGAPWTEIDFPEDLERARRVIAPAIRAIEWQRIANAAAIA